MPITAAQLYGNCPKKRYCTNDENQGVIDAPQLNLPYNRQISGSFAKRQNNYSYGDGYTVFQTDGINTETETYSITTPFIPAIDCKTLLLKLKGFYDTPFEWINRPDDCLYKYFFITPPKIDRRSNNIYRTLSFNIQNWKNGPI